MGNSTAKVNTGALARLYINIYLFHSNDKLQIPGCFPVVVVVAH